MSFSQWTAVPLALSLRWLQFPRIEATEPLPSTTRIPTDAHPPPRETGMASPDQLILLVAPSQ